MNSFFKPRILATALSTLFLCSCVAPPSGPPLIVPLSHIPASKLPGSVVMNDDAGRGNWIFVTVRMQNGEALPCVLDTGAFSTLLDKSLEPKLGRRIDSGTLRVFGAAHRMNQYDAPALYMGRTPLMMTGPYIFTDNLKSLSNYAGRPILGMIGMDILAHYCVQFDFVANKVRFLNGPRSDKREWGAPYPLTDGGDGCFSISQNLTGTAGPASLIDAGCTYDGWLVPDLYRQWTNRAAPPMKGQVRFPRAILGGSVYTDVNLEGLRPKLFSSGDPHLKLNGIGLTMMSRNLVTLDFPERTLYLKPICQGPFVDQAMRRRANSEALSAVHFLTNLARQGQLPGWSAADQPAQSAGAIQFHFSYPHIVTVDDFRKKGDPSIYHYRVMRGSANGPWKLVKAWRSDSAGKLIEKYLPK
ncbi:MAG TPA: hypothetical protein VNV43_10060 [Candidatus Acidoferrales bacterium]|nr:hypothetical protein [Candidatus Acidoferrales bacterium]